MEEDRSVQAYRVGRGRLVVFDDVDVATLVEVEAGEVRVPLFHVVRDAANKTVRQISEEIREAQASKAGLELRRRQIRWARRIPRPIRRLVWRALANRPRTWKRYGGTVVLTSVGMFGDGAGWGFTTAGGYPLPVTAGGIAERPALVGGAIEAREYLSLAVSFDHTVVDGAPATRFAARLEGLIEDGHGLVS